MISHRGTETQRARILSLMFSLCLCVSVAFLFPALLHATTIAGAVLDAAGNPIASGKLILRLSQEGTVSDPALLLIQPPVTCTITNGQIDAGCVVRGNDTISPAGTFYRVRIVGSSGQELLPQRRYTITGASFDFGTATPLASDLITAQAYQIVQDEGAPLIQQRTLNFVGAGVAATNDAANNRTTVTVSGGGGGSQHQVDGANVAANDPINFQDSATVDFTNPSAGNIQAAVKDSSVTAAKLNVASPSSAQLSGVDGDNIAAAALSPDRVSGTALVQADATTTPTANKIPQADGTGKIADGWLSASVSLLGQSIGTTELEDNAATDAKVANTITLDNLTQITSRSILDTSGILTLARGGTNQTAWTASRCVRVNDAATGLESAASDCGSGGGGATHQIDGVNLSAQDPINFQDTATIDFTNPSAGNIQAQVKDASLGAAKLSSGAATSTQALFSDGASGAAYRSLADADVPNTITLDNLTQVTTRSILDTTGILTPARGGAGANNTASASRYLRGDGTNFVTSSVAAGGAGSCTNQFVRAANDNAAPTCASVGSADISSGAVGAAALADTYHTFIHSIVIFDPTTSDTNRVQHKFPSAVTLTRLSCSTNTGTASINFDERGETTPNTAGTNVLSSALVCDTDSQITSTFSDASVAANAPLNLQITAASGTPGVVRIHLEFRVD